MLCLLFLVIFVTYFFKIIGLKKNILFIVILMVFMKLHASQRTLYVDDFNTILGSPVKEDKLLKFAKKHQFSILILYQLNKVDKRFSLTNPELNISLAEFIAKAKTKFGILQIGASGESASFFTDRIDVYNNTRNKPEEKFDIYNLEYEYWSNKASGDGGYYCINYLEEKGVTCDRQGSFNYFLDNLKEMKSLANENIHEIKIDAYVGYYTTDELSEIIKYCDRLIIHAYGKNPKLCFVTAKKNLEKLYQINSKIKASILFSTRMNHMGYWLKHDSLESGETLFVDKMQSVNLQLKKRLNLDGFSYHTYSFLEKSISYYSYTRN